MKLELYSKEHLLTVIERKNAELSRLYDDLKDYRAYKTSCKKQEAVIARQRARIERQEKRIGRLKEQG